MKKILFICAMAWSVTGMAQQSYLSISSNQKLNADEVFLADLPLANEKVSPIVLKPTLLSEYEAKNAPGLRMRNTGRTLTILGSAMFIGGIILVSNAESTYYTYQSSNYGDTEEGDPKGALGVLMMVGGTGMIVPGIILWSKGAKKYNRYLEKEKSASIQWKGNGLTYQF